MEAHRVLGWNVPKFDNRMQDHFNKRRKKIAAQDDSRERQRERERKRGRSSTKPLQKKTKRTRVDDSTEEDTDSDSGSSKRKANKKIKQSKRVGACNQGEEVPYTSYSKGQPLDIVDGDGVVLARASLLDDEPFLGDSIDPGSFKTVDIKAVIKYVHVFKLLYIYIYIYICMLITMLI